MATNDQLKWTGERLVTDEALGKGVIEHLHRYALASSFIKGKKVIDIACGEGYGSNLMSMIAASVTGIDISPETIQHARKKYKNSNLTFLSGSAIKFPCEDKSVDVVVSFETLEHHDKHEEMMVEILRVLTNDGMLIISTPEKVNYNKIDKDNPYHIKELNFDEFSELIKTFFNFRSFLAQSYFYGSVIIPNELRNNKVTEYNGDFKSIVEKDFYNNRIYNIAIASNADLPLGIINESLFNGDKNLGLFYDKVIEAAIHQNTKAVKQTTSYRLGNMLVRPLKKIRLFFKKSVNTQ